MTVPVLLVTGFLGAGKTTLINTLLQGSHGQRIAAIVNDFGAINIDAELLQSASDTVIGLRNGCICCSLQGDLLRTLRLVLIPDPRPDAIVIEASGVADPRGIIETIMDPILWQSVSLDAVVCVVDAVDVLASPARMDDSLWCAQAGAADFLLLAKTQEIEADQCHQLIDTLKEAWGKPVFSIDAEPLPLELLLGGVSRPTARQHPGAERVDASRFATLEWSTPASVSLPEFQAALGQMATGLLRAKGFMRFIEKPGSTHVFQLVGRRATFLPQATAPKDSGCRLVLIGEADRFDAAAAGQALDAMAVQL